MALKIADRVKETSLTQGSGSLTLEGAFGGFQTFSATVGDGNTTYYVIENESKWEVGIGTYTSSSNTLSRDTVLKSSQGGDKINIYGVATVFCSYPADRAVIRQEDGLITESGLLTLTIDSAGNFFHAYKDDAYDRTIGLYTDGNTSPEWRLGLKNSPSDKTDPPSFGYVYGKDGQVGLVGNSNNSITLSNSSEFSVKHNNLQVLRASSLTGIHLNANSSAYPAVTINGAAAQSQPLTEWADSVGNVLSIVDQDGKVGINKTSATYELDVDGSGKLESVYLTSGIYFQDGTFQATAHSDVLTSQVSGWADTTITNGDNAVSGWADSTMTSRDNAVSGWADSTMDTRDAAVSGWAGSYADARDAAVSGWAGSTITNEISSLIDSAPSTLDTLNEIANAINDDANIATTLTNLITDTSGNLQSQIVSNDSDILAVSGWADSTMDVRDAAISGWADSTMDARDAAVSGWAEAYVDSQDHSATAISGWADSTMDTRDAAVSGWAGSYADAGDAAVSGWADSTMDTRDAAVSGWANATFITTDNDTTYTAGSGLELHGTEFQAAISGANLLATNTPTDSYVASYDAATGKFTWVANAGGGGATYTAGSGLVLDGDNKFHSTFASGNYLLGEIRDNSSSGVAISGIANFASGLAIQNEIDIATVSGLLYDDSSLSGYVDSRDTAVSGWAKAYVDSQDHSATAVSGWADSTMTSRDNAVSGWADSTMDTRDAAVSGWAGSYADAGDAAVSGWADSTMDTRDAAVSGYFETRTDQNANDIVSVSGIAAYASGHNLQSITDNGSSTTNSISSSGNITATTGILDVLDLTLLGNGSQPSHSEGVVFYDSENHTLSLYNDEADVTLQLGQEEFLRVRNNTGSTIYNGSGVRIIGAHGSAAPTIEPAIASTEEKSQIVGLATHDIENETFGYVTTYGIVRDINTVGFSAGDELFLDASTSGNLTNVSPTIPNYKVTIGHVIRSHANGSILVQIGHPKLGGGDLKSEAAVTLSGVPFVTSIADTNAGGMQTNSSFVYDSGNNQLQLGSGVQLLNAVPSNTSNVLYNDGGTLKFNGSAVDTNTTYTGGTNLTLDGTTFNVDDAFLKNDADDTTSGTVTMANLIVGDAGNIGSASDNDAVAIASDGEVTLSQRTTFSKAQKTPIKSNTDGATITFDLDEANTHTVTLGGDRTLALSNANVGQRFVIRLVQDGTGTRTVTWFSTINWPGGLVPTLTTTGGKTDVFGFICTATNTYDGFVIGYNL